MPGILYTEDVPRPDVGPDLEAPQETPQPTVLTPAEDAISDRCDEPVGRVRTPPIQVHNTTPGGEKVCDLHVDIDAANKAVSSALAGILLSALPPSSSRNSSRSSLDVPPTPGTGSTSVQAGAKPRLMSRSHSLSSRALYQASARMVSQVPPQDWPGQQYAVRGAPTQRYAGVRVPNSKFEHIMFPGAPGAGPPRLLGLPVYPMYNQGPNLMHPALNLLQQQQQQQLLMHLPMQAAGNHPMPAASNGTTPHSAGSFHDMQLRALLAAQQQQQQLLMNGNPLQQGAWQQPSQQHLPLLYQQQQNHVPGGAAPLAVFSAPVQVQDQHQQLLQLSEEVFSGLLAAARQQGDQALEQQLQGESALLFQLLDVLVHFVRGQLEDAQAVAALDGMASSAARHVANLKAKAGGAASSVLSPALKLAIQDLLQVIFSICPMHRQNPHQAVLRALAALTSCDPDVGTMVMVQLRMHLRSMQPEPPQQRELSVRMLMDLASSAYRSQQGMIQGRLLDSIASPPGSSAGAQPAGAGADGPGGFASFGAVGLNIAQQEALGEQHSMRHQLVGPLIPQGHHGAVGNRSPLTANSLHHASDPSIADSDFWGGPCNHQLSMATTWEEDEDDGGAAGSGRSRSGLSRSGLPEQQQQQQQRSNLGRPFARPSAASMGGGLPGLPSAAADQEEESGTAGLLGEAFQGLDIMSWLQQVGSDATSAGLTSPQQQQLGRMGVSSGSSNLWLPPPGAGPGGQQSEPPAAVGFLRQGEPPTAGGLMHLGDPQAAAGFLHLGRQFGDFRARSSPWD